MKRSQGLANDNLLSRTLWDQYRPGDVEIQLHVYYRDTFSDYLHREDPFLHQVIKGEVVYEAPSEAGEPLYAFPS